MKSCCLKCRKYTENINPRVLGTSNGKVMILSKCATCGSKKWRFIKNQDAKGLLSNLGLKTPLPNIPILGDILFWSATSLSCIKNEWNSKQVLISRW